MTDRQLASQTSNPVGAPKVFPTERPKSPDDELGRFEQLADKLVNVPKSELDEKRAKKKP